MPESLAKEGWAKTTLADCCEEIAERIDNPAESGFERFVGLEHLETGETSVRNWGSTEDVTSSMKLFKSGDVIVARRNVYLQRAGRANFDGVCSGDGIVLRGNRRVCLPELLPFLLNTDDFWSYVTSQADGTMSKRITVKRLLSYELALPPLEEQRRLSKLISTVEKASDSIQSAKKHAELCSNAYIYELFSDGFGNKFQFPLRRLREVLSVLKDGDHTPPKRGATSGPMLLSVSHLNHGTLTYGDSERRVSEEHFNKIHKNWVIKPGDALVAVIGATLGKVAIVPEAMPPFTLQRMVAVLRTQPEIMDQTFLHLFLKSPQFRQACWSRARVTAQPALYLSEIADILVPVPPKSMQASMVASARKTNTAIKGLESRLSQIGLVKARLRERMFE